jgi:calicheamicin 3'-O-methyl-rhamnosyltransferase
MLSLAHALQAQGQSVAWATGADALCEIAGLGFTGWACGPTRAESRAALLARWPDHDALPARASSQVGLARLFGSVVAPAMLEPLRLIMGLWRPALVIHATAAFAAPPLCRALGVPRVEHAFGWRLRGNRLRSVDAVVDALESAPRKGSSSATTSTGPRLIDITPPSMRHPHKGTRASVLDLRPGPGRGDSLTDLPQSVRALLMRRGNRPVVCISFGTAFARRPVFAEAISAIAAAPLALIAIGVPSRTLASPPNDDFVAEPWIDQDALLPWCDALVSHGGAGTVLGGLAHGLPQLVLPQGADHFINASAVRLRGVGVAIPPNAVKQADLAETTMRLVSESRWRREARAVAGEIAAMPGPGDLAKHLARTLLE